MNNKVKILFYKHWFAPVKIKNLIPGFYFSSNVQGYFYTRNYSINWLTYCLLLELTSTHNIDKNREDAHEMNVNKFKHGLQR